MQMSLSVLTLQLAKDATMRVDAARGVCLRVRSGRLWITEEGFPDDVFLEPGQEWTLRGNGRAVVQADRAAAVDLVEPCMRAWRPLRAGRHRAQGCDVRGIRGDDSRPGQPNRRRIRIGFAAG